jgi:hypothetical protein
MFKIYLPIYAVLVGSFLFVSIKLIILLIKDFFKR